jgi:ketosteroid isomerase-like protein
MKRLLILFLLAGVAPSIITGQTRSRKTEQELLKLQRQWLDAYQKHDAAALERIEVDDFTLTESDGKVTTKAEDVASIKNAKPPQPDDSFDVEDVKVRLYGDTAVLIGRVILKYRNKGQMVAERYRYTDTYLKRHGRWRVVASQLTAYRRYVLSRSAGAATHSAGLAREHTFYH